MNCVRIVNSVDCKSKTTIKYIFDKKKHCLTNVNHNNIKSK